jgi:hypothetical protein
MIQRCFINHITKLEDSQGTILLTHQEITHEISGFYKELLSEPHVDHTSAIERVTQKIPTLITQEHKESLMTPITQEEVDQDLQDLPIEKDRDPVGFTIEFFHSCWPMIRDEVWHLV